MFFYYYYQFNCVLRFYIIIINLIVCMQEKFVKVGRFVLSFEFLVIHPPYKQIFFYGESCSERTNLCYRFLLNVTLIIGSKSTLFLLLNSTHFLKFLSFEVHLLISSLFFQFILETKDLFVQ